jgi:hypothetical protein
MKSIYFTILLIFTINMNELTIQAQVVKIDSTFNIGFGFDGPVLDIGIQSDGKIIAVGKFNHFNNYLSPNIVRLNKDGSYDATFQSPIKTRSIFNVINKLRIQPNGQILISGQGLVPIDTTFFPGDTLYSPFARLNPNGSVDLSFTQNAYNSTFRLIGIPGGGVDFEFQNDGSIIYLMSDVTLAFKLLNNGNLGEISNIPWLRNYEEFTPVLSKLLIANNLDIFVFGDFDSVLTLAQTYPRHKMTIFDNQLNIQSNSHSIDTTVYSVLKLNNDQFLIGGSFSTYDNNVANQIAKIDNNGNFDNTFSLSEFLYCERVFSMAQSNNYLFLATKNGYFEGNQIKNLSIFNMDGSYNEIANQHTSTDSYIYTVVSDNTGQIYIGGNFLSFDGKSYPRLCKLKFNESIVSSNTYLNENGVKVFIYPNPTTGNFSIKGIKSSGILSIYDYTGKLLVQNMNLSVENNVDVSYLYSGYYTLIIESEGKKYMDKLIISK